MPNEITSQGLTIQTTPEIIDEILNGTETFPGMYDIYGPDINVDANSPDGQMINIVAQAKADVLEVVRQVFNSYDPDKAIGVALNSRCAINGIIRNPGTYTIQPVSVTADRALTLPGLDTAPTAPFTVQDNSGNKYALVNAYAFSGAATTSLSFQAVLLGPVTSLVNTITVVTTVTLGITAVNNPAALTTLGTTEETDYAFRVRRQRSVQLPNKGFLDGIRAGILAVSGVTQARVLENKTDSTDANLIPGHSIWAIVLGGTNAAVANAIYVKRGGGCGMKGSVSVNVLQVDGSYDTILFDRPTNENLWIEFDVAAVGSGTFDPVYIRAQLLLLLAYEIGQSAVASDITALVLQINPGCSVSGAGVSSDGSTYVSLLATSTVDKLWALAAARIKINGVTG